MCVERVQRFLTAAMLLLITALALNGFFYLSVGLQIFVIAMLMVWAATNFCPSIWVLNKILPPCKWS
ncbi:MAG: phosphoribosylaminoimidazole synthetase [Sulfurospirillaceae bacterium]|nr:phosphoribosylaminoimidazole synthetase [Sulfurospirillaceae bacterium]MCK9546476.1 phosphoribosylaminoimidazole synthetase [Sulfurospirillaceae bacterium]